MDGLIRFGWVFWVHSYYQGRIQSLRFGGAISAIFGSQVLLRVHWEMKYFTTLLWENNGRQNGLISRMLFSELCKIMVDRVTFVGFREGDCPLPWICPCLLHICVQKMLKKQAWYRESFEKALNRMWSRWTTLNASNLNNSELCESKFWTDSNKKKYLLLWNKIFYCILTPRFVTRL